MNTTINEKYLEAANCAYAIARRRHLAVSAAAIFERPANVAKLVDAVEAAARLGDRMMDLAAERQTRRAA
jgi:hypothetical protein